MFKALHLADLHYGNNPDILAETDRCSHFALDIAEKYPPDLIIFAGDTADEYQGRIRVDSEAARLLIALVQRAASIAPVVIIRGTKSHDRDTPYLFRHLTGRFPIHVATAIEQVMLVDDDNGHRIFVYPDKILPNYFPVSFLTLIPSVDKEYLMATFKGSIQEGNMETRGLLHDLFAGLGLVNAGVSDIPRIAVIHGMCTGAKFSSGQTAIGEDLEFSLNDLAQLDVDYVAMGHVHMQQCFTLSTGAKACYSGSPGRLNFGEQEEKGVLMVEFDGQPVKEIINHPTPARRFALESVEWGEGGAAAIIEAANKLALTCDGADVRFRYTIPEENKHEVDRVALQVLFLDAGARGAKVEYTVIPKIRTRAAGISRVSTLPEKVSMWAATVGVEVPERVLAIALVIEGMSVEELLADAEKHITGELADGLIAGTIERVHACVDGDLGAYPTRKEITGYNSRSEEKGEGQPSANPFDTDQGKLF